jgi:hypothetical protein
LGEPTDFLGIQITRDKAAGTITIHQTDKALALAKAVKVEGTRKVSPMTPEAFFNLQSAQTGEHMADKEE